MTAKRKKTFIAAAIIAAVTILYLTLSLMPRGNNYSGENPMMKDGRLPILIAHGGGNKEFPDNTLEAFYNAYSVDERVMMETDVSITKDGVVILSHDTTLDRKTNVSGNISDWNYTDLIAEEVDFGYSNPTEDGVLSGERKKYVSGDGEERTPLDVSYPEGVSPRHESVFLATTLEELIVAFPSNRINVEIKQSGELGKSALYEVLRILAAHDAFDRVVLASFHTEIYEEFIRLVKEGGVPKSFMFSPATAGVVKYFILHTLSLDVFFGDGICVFQIPTDEYGFNLASKHLVSNAHDHNVAVHYWTINDKDEMRHLIDIGADGIMTDYPHRLAEVYAERASSLDIDGNEP